MSFLIAHNSTVVSQCISWLCWEAILRGLQIGLTAVIGLVAPLYPRFSRYRRQATDGIDTLEEIVFKSGSVRVGVIETGEDGFKELVEAVDSYYPLSGEVQRIKVAVGHPKSIENQLNMELGAMVGPNAIVFAEYKDSVEREHDIITFHPFDPAQTLKLTELRRWVQSRTRDKGNAIVVAATLLWTVVSMTVVIWL
ncbi:hypothetical protein [Halomarina litorea]|uniref:hypothetical protein n=1 Tax=Halomarina litorea TaxID=2961595 RepID=UPI0020C2D1BD|nr:hypothetical protein [Halomarina sp. BCD28]